MNSRSKAISLAALVAASLCLGTIALAQSPKTPAPQPPPKQDSPQQDAPQQEAPQQEAPPKQEAAPRPADIDRNGVLILIRTTLLALDHANKTGNYTVFRDIASPSFQAVNTAARLGEIFAWQRRENLDLSGVAALDPQLTVLPQIEPNGLMRMAGLFPSVPSQIKFEMLFAPTNAQWKLFGIGMSLDKTGPGAPQK
jgi:hypothetical protein